MFILDAFDPILQHKETATNFTPVWVGGIIIVVSIILGIILLFKADEIDTGLSVMTLVPILTVLICGIVFVFINVSPPDYDIKGTQKWVEQTYLIELTPEQTNELILNRVEDVNNKSDQETTLVKYYGNNVFVQLVKIDDEWVLFKNDEEMPRTTQ